jgi:hypothetical protein
VDGTKGCKESGVWFGRYLGNSAISKGIAVVGETVADKPQFALFDVLLDGIVVLVLADFLLGVGPARDFDDHVEDLGGCGWARGEEGDIVPRRHNNTVLLKVDAVFKRVGRAYTR